MSDRFRAIGVRVGFSSTGLDQELYEEHDPQLWSFSEDETENDQLCLAVQKEISQHLEPVFAHFASIGAVRADVAEFNQGDNTPVFFLIVEGGDDSFGDLSRLVDGEALNRSLGCLSGVGIEIKMEPMSIDLDDWQVSIDPAGLHALLASIDTADAVRVWGGPATPDRLPRAGEAANEWLARVAIPAVELARMADHWEMVGRNAGLYARLSVPDEDADFDWLVEGMIAFGRVTLIAGASEAGKSSACHELLSAASGLPGVNGKTFLGQPIHGRHPAAILFAEEGDSDFEYRHKRHQSQWPGCAVMSFPSDQFSLRETLTTLSTLKRGVLAIDPAQALIEGDDTRSNVASDFYNPLVEFARACDWAVIVVHHLIKDPPKTLARMIPSIKGSTVHVDRPRMVIGMIDRGNGMVGVGPIKFNFPAEVAWARRNEERLFRRDPVTYTLVPVDVSPLLPQRDNAIGELVLAAITSLNKTGTKVRRTGRSGLFEQKHAALSGIARSAIQSAIVGLLENGQVVETADGLRAVIDPAPS